MNIVFLGLPGVPYLRRACDIRIMSIAKLIVNMGDQVTIFNKYPVRNKNEREFDNPYDPNIKFIEVFDINLPKSKFLRGMMILLSFPREIFLLIKFNRKSKIDIFHIYTGHFIDVFVYYIFARLFKAKVVYHYEEFRSVIKRQGIYHWINGYLIDYLGYYFFDGAICISNYLQNHINSHAPKISTIKIPPICDFDYFDSIKAKKTDFNYILFCGSAGYFDLIKFVVDSYMISKGSAQKIKLLLVINGSIKEIEKVKNYIDINEYIKIVSNLTYFDLIVHYKSAKALLIPNRNTIQDEARFPNKICEYTASQAVIITVNYGEIPYYFENELNAIIANEYSIKLFADKIDWVLDHEDCSTNLKENAYKLGKQYFDIPAYKDNLPTFLNHLLEK